MDVRVDSGFMPIGVWFRRGRSALTARELQYVSLMRTITPDRLGSTLNYIKKKIYKK